MFKKILIANRGEIALRIIRTCRAMGIRTVAVFSEADKKSLHVKYADEAVNIGPPIARKSYLNMEKIIEAAKEKGAQAIHPGYGFFAENASFASACINNGLTFIGPSPDTIARAGNKSSARQTLRNLRVQVIPGSEDIISSEKEALELAEEVGYPVIIKAAGGGGGRGMRIIHNNEHLVAEMKIAAGEALAAFGNPDLYLEKYIKRPRHIEIQILSDQLGNYIHLGERECSIQKRYQKLIEESPSPCVDDVLRKKMGETALFVARSIGYTNAGTVEFLLDEHNNFYFMEVNARIQVEHPVTEMVTGIDMVRQQILIAGGERLGFEQHEIKQNGWSIECRINAEDPNRAFAPSPGVVKNLVLPEGPGVRVDTHIYENYEVPPFYDSLLGKLIVWAEDRGMAILRMQKALSDFSADGIKVTVPFYRMVFQDSDFIRGNIDTHFLEKFLDL